jgi:hypothetical protein
MCRSIKTLCRAEGVATEQKMYEAASQFVRKVSGYRVPSQAVFEEAVWAILAT